MKYYTTKELAVEMRVSMRTVYRWIHDGKIKVERGPKKILIASSEVEKIKWK